MNQCAFAHLHGFSALKSAHIDRSILKRVHWLNNFSFLTGKKSFRQCFMQYRMRWLIEKNNSGSHKFIVSKDWNNLATVSSYFCFYHHDYHYYYYITIINIRSISLPIYQFSVGNLTVSSSIWDLHLHKWVFQNAKLIGWWRSVYNRQQDLQNLLSDA